MNRLFIFSVFFAMSLTYVAAQQAASQQVAVVELTFTFTRQSGSASNQFAVWIENTEGRLVKTLYATRFTADGGWKRRASSIPVWVNKSGLSDLSKAQVDALTGATPKTGTLTYIWDGTDSSGASVPAGNYVIFLEGTLRWENQVLYHAPIVLGQELVTPSASAEKTVAEKTAAGKTVEVSVEYTGEAGSDSAMIGNVAVKLFR